MVAVDVYYVLLPHSTNIVNRILFLTIAFLPFTFDYLVKHVSFPFQARGSFPLVFLSFDFLRWIAIASLVFQLHTRKAQAWGVSTVSFQEGQSWPNQ
ncbi:hypothetical protein R1flu_022192 [Riccia fluitans]|uniref:Uncharacterized protein n=1 Tax=Riccia fluitans TaxID=41844 RepID=A0ABD1ZUL1_9MARC